jgi:hypothetical protein
MLPPLPQGTLRACRTRRCSPSSSAARPATRCSTAGSPSIDSAHAAAARTACDHPWTLSGSCRSYGQGDKQTEAVDGDGAARRNRARRRAVEAPLVDRVTTSRPRQPAAGSDRSSTESKSWISPLCRGFRASSGLPGCSHEPQIPAISALVDSVCSHERSHGGVRSGRRQPRSALAV